MLLHSDPRPDDGDQGNQDAHRQATPAPRRAECRSARKAPDRDQLFGLLVWSQSIGESSIARRKSPSGPVSIRSAPAWPWYPITAMTVLVTTAFYLWVRAGRNGRPISVQLGITTSLVLLFAAPLVTIIATENLICTDTGYSARPLPNMGVVGLMVLAVLAAVSGLSLVAGEPAGKAWRLPVVLAAALVPAFVLEGLFSFYGLDTYCDGSKSALYTQAGAAIVVPILVAVGLALRLRAKPS